MKRNIIVTTTNGKYDPSKESMIGNLATVPANSELFATPCQMLLSITPNIKETIPIITNIQKNAIFDLDAKEKINICIMRPKNIAKKA